MITLKNHFQTLQYQKSFALMNRWFLPFKGNKWGYKLHVVSGIDRLIHNFGIHTGVIQPCPNQS